MSLANATKAPVEFVMTNVTTFKPRMTQNTMQTQDDLQDTQDKSGFLGFNLHNRNLQAVA